MWHVLSLVVGSLASLFGFRKGSGVVIRAFPLPEGLGFDALPPGYGYKGGVARDALRKLLGRTLEGARDVDLVRLEGAGSPETDDALARRYMPDDYRHGHGVEVVESLLAYMTSRDFTVNQVVVLGQVLYASEDCLRDLTRRRLRLCKQGRDRNHPKALTRVWRWLATWRVNLAERWRFVDEPTSWTWTHVPLFWLALDLRKSMAAGPQVTAAYLHEVLRRRLLASSDLDGAVSEIAAGLRQGVSFFDPVPDWAKELPCFRALTDGNLFPEADNAERGDPTLLPFPGARLG